MASQQTRGPQGVPSERKHSPAIKPPAKEVSRSPISTPASGALKGLSPVEPKGLGTLTHDQISKAAYLRWLEKGGDARTNWLEAEAELRAKSALGIA